MYDVLQELPLKAPEPDRSDREARMVDNMSNADILKLVTAMTKGTDSILEEPGESALGPTGEMSKTSAAFLTKVVERGLVAEQYVSKPKK